MSSQEYHATLLQAAQISEILTRMLDEDAQDLLEAYSDIYARIVEYECVNHVA